jgi:hypothetical protein
VTNAAGLRFFDMLAQRGPARRAAFALMPSRGYANAGGPSFNISPMAAGPNLPVIGGGTLGRLTKWTGFTSSNSFRCYEYQDRAGVHRWRGNSFGSHRAAA